jgi:hypothetical protein
MTVAHMYQFVIRSQTPAWARQHSYATSDASNVLRRRPLASVGLRTHERIPITDSAATPQRITDPWGPNHSRMSFEPALGTQVSRSAFGRSMQSEPQFEVNVEGDGVARSRKAISCTHSLSFCKPTLSAFPCSAHVRPTLQRAVVFGRLTRFRAGRGDFPMPSCPARCGNGHAREGARPARSQSGSGTGIWFQNRTKALAVMAANRPGPHSCSKAAHETTWICRILDHRGPDAVRQGCRALGGGSVSAAMKEEMPVDEVASLSTPGFDRATRNGRAHRHPSSVAGEVAVSACADESRLVVLTRAVGVEAIIVAGWRPSRPRLIS